MKKKKTTYKSSVNAYPSTFIDNENDAGDNDDNNDVN